MALGAFAFRSHLGYTGGFVTGTIAPVPTPVRNAFVVPDGRIWALNLYSLVFRAP